MPVKTWQELQREKDLKRAADWQLAVDKLQVTFEAEHGGGYPECLKELTPKERLRYLRELGFRVRERYVFRDDDHWPGKPEDTQWARLTGGISVNLTDGFVCKGVS